jgi:hypothetical protein
MIMFLQEWNCEVLGKLIFLASILRELHILYQSTWQFIYLIKKSIIKTPFRFITIYSVGSPNFLAHHIVPYRNRPSTFLIR